MSRTTAGTAGGASMPARGVVFVHSAPPAVCPHVESAVSGVLGARTTLDWTGQPAAPGQLRAELSWQSDPGTAARITTAMRGWDRVRFEVTEDAALGAEGVRFSWTPSLGLHTAVTGVHGDVLVPEDRLRSALATAAAQGEDIAAAVERLLGKPWDDELEPFRHAGDGAPVRWLHQVV